MHYKYLVSNFESHTSTRVIFQPCGNTAYAPRNTVPLECTSKSTALESRKQAASFEFHTGRRFPLVAPYNPCCNYTSSPSSDEFSSPIHKSSLVQNGSFVPRQGKDEC